MRQEIRIYDTTTRELLFVYRVPKEYTAGVAGVRRALVPSPDGVLRDGTRVQEHWVPEMQEATEARH